VQAIPCRRAALLLACTLLLLRYLAGIWRYGSAARGRPVRAAPERGSLRSLRSQCSCTDQAA
jgi:predicted nucleotidyltransferase